MSATTPADSPYPAIGDPGRAAQEIPSGPPPPGGAFGLGHACGDIRLSEHATAGVTVRAATVRGLLHRHQGTERQDEFAVASFDDGATVLAVVADGVGSLPRSREAAALGCRVLPREWARHRGDWDAVFGAVNTELHRYIATWADGERVMATTLTCVVVSLRTAHDDTPGYDVEVAWVGDSPAAALRDGAWWWLTRSGDDDPLAGTPITALPTTSARPHTRTYTLRGGDVVLAMSDGVGNPLARAPGVGEQLARWWQDPPDVFTFGAQTGFARRSFTDDRTAVGLWLTPPAAADAGPGPASEVRPDVPPDVGPVHAWQAGPETAPDAGSDTTRGVGPDVRPDDDTAPLPPVPGTVAPDEDTVP